MRAKLLLNDIHLGVMRAGGTTPKSAAAIRQYLLTSLRELMMQHIDKDIIINGDLFDTFQVSLSDLLAFYEIACEWLAASDGRLFFGRGNHDWAKDSSKLSSFDFVGQILESAYPGRVVVVTKPQMLDEGVFMIPHMPNQAMFDLELKKASEELKDTLVLLHANYDNNFAVESDHSLNVSPEQAEALISGGNRLVFGHEHQARTTKGGRVFVTGNQWPSSVADCVHNPDGLKHAHMLQKEADGGIGICAVETWSAAKSFAEVPWDDLLDGEPHDFVRVVGSVTAEQSADVIATISKFRQKSDAFVVTNAVKVEGVSDMEELAASVEDVKSFDALGYLLENLDPDQAEFVRDLLAKDRVEERKAA